MLGYILRRLAWATVLIVAVTAVTFAIFFLLPGSDPALARAGKSPTPELLAAIREQFGLDGPWYEQYWHFLRELAQLDFGRSYVSNADVDELILDRLPATLSLVLGAAVIWVLVGVAVGVASAARPRSLLDRLSMGAALLAISASVYWLGLVALYLFSEDLGRLPLLPGADAYRPLSEDPVAWLGSLVLPWAVLAASFAGIYARVLRGNLREVLAEDYIRTARAKGLSERRVVLRHGLRSAIAPIVTLAGVDVGILLGGAILTKSVFNIPGIGRLAFTAIERSDLPTIQGCVVFGAIFIVLCNLLVDIAYAFLDPRVRY